MRVSTSVAGSEAEASSSQVSVNEARLGVSSSVLNAPDRTFFLPDAWRFEAGPCSHWVTRVRISLPMSASIASAQGVVPARKDGYPM